MSIRTQSRRVRSQALITLMLCALPLTAAAQTTMATVRGKIVDEQGLVLPGATVTARQVETNAARPTVTAEGGQYFIANLPAGSYEVLVELAGFVKQRRDGLVLQVGQEVTIDFTLKVGGVQESIDVVGSAGLLETTRTTLGATIKKEQLDNLPVLNRDFSSLALLAPGVTTGTGGYAAGGTGEMVSINGQRAFTNQVVVDGASNMWQFYGKQASTFSQDWIQEFQVLTNSFAAEFGTASGGIMNVITRSGSNQFRGRGYAFFRSADWDSAPFAGRFQNGQPVFLDNPAPFTQRRWGGYLGGPVVRNRVFFFAGYEDLLTKGTDLLGISEYWRNQGLQTAIPTKVTDHPVMVKGDINFNSAHRASLRYDRSINVNYNQGSALQTVGARQTFGGPVWNVVGNLTSTLSNATFNELRGSFLSNKPPILCNQAGAGGSALLNLGPPGTFSRKTYPGATFGCGFTGLEAEQDLTLGDSLSMVRGHHQLKVGGQVLRVTTIIDSLNVRNGSWSFPRDLAFDLNNPLTYADSWSGGLSVPRYSEPAWNMGLFVQDSWTARDDLTINLGLRYDVDQGATIENKFIGAKNDRIQALVGGPPVYQPQTADKNNVGPRLGVVWRPGNDKKTIVRGAAGWFYDMNHNNYTVIIINNTLLTENSYSFNANNSLQNPFYNAADPTGSANRLRSYLAQLYPYWPDISLLPTTKQTLATLDGLTVGYTRQYTAGVNRELPFGIVVDADLVYAQGIDGIVSVNDNVKFANGLYVEVDPRFAALNHYRNLGWTRYQALQTQAQWRRGPSALGVSYTLGKATSNYSTTITGGAATNPLDLSEDAGPDNSDRRHGLTVNGASLLPFGIQVAGIYTYRGALPYSVSTRFQLDADPFTDRPEPRNSRRGDPLQNVDVRLTKILRFGAATRASVFWEMFNVFNTVNFTTYEGSLESANFGLPLAASPMRRQQIGVRFEF